MGIQVPEYFNAIIRAMTAFIIIMWLENSANTIRLKAFIAAQFRLSIYINARVIQ